MKRLLYYGTVGVLLAGWFLWRGWGADEVRVIVAADGVMLDGQPIGLAQLEARLMAMRQDDPALRVVIVTGADTPASAVLPVVERAEGAGVADVQFEVAPVGGR